METIFAVAGVAIVLITLLDALWTTLWVDGAAGPLTRKLTTWSWRGVLKVSGRRHHKALSAFGPSILTLTVVMWVVLLALGWVLVFASDPQSLRTTSEPRMPAEWTGRIWYVAYSMFTVGNGDFTPQGGLWQVVSSIVSGSGMALVTLAISYLLSVLSAVVGKRSFAGQVSGLGSSPQEVVASGWNGRDLHSLDRHLAALSSQLSTLTQQYQSYPVLQYYHAAEAAKSPVKAVGVLDDALTILRSGVPPEVRPEPSTLASARSTVGTFLDAFGERLVTPTADVPPPPGLEGLRRQGIPVVAEEDFARALEDAADRRRRLHAVIRSDGWEWEAQK